MTNMLEQKVDLIAADDSEGAIHPAALGDVLRALEPTVRKSVRMAFEGRSAAAGRPPDWLTASSDLRLADVAIQRQRTVLTFALPSFGTAAPSLYAQTELFPTLPNRDLTALDMFAGVLSGIAKSDEDSDRYDRSLLRGVLLFGGGFNSSFTRMELHGSGAAQALDPALIDRARELHDRTPPSRQVRIVGSLDMIRVSTSSFALKLDDGTEVRCVTSNDIAEAQQFLGKQVLVHGKAVYKPSGRLLRIEVEALENGLNAPALWHRVPDPIRAVLTAPQLRAAGPRSGGMSSFFGRWPGDESETELLAGLDS